MREAFYGVIYGTGQGGSGYAVLAVCGGHVAGGDAAAGVYKGLYALNQQTGLYDLSLVVDLPPGMMSVFGQTAPPSGMKINAKCSLPQDPDGRQFQVQTQYGSVDAFIFRLRDIP